VEIKQLKLQGIAITKIDVSELPAQLNRIALRYASAYPLYLAYKFLSPIYILTLQVTKHNDVEVLIAAIDECVTKVTVVPEGKLIYSVRMTVRNTEKQYIRFETVNKKKENITIWSALVGGNSVKPAKDDKDQVMIPLLKRSGTALAETGFDVELSYMSEISALQRRGIIEILLPRVDIPISLYKVSIFFPTTFKFRNFGGNIEKIDFFSNSNSVINFGAVAPSGPAYGQAMPTQMQMQPQMQMQIQQRGRGRQAAAPIARTNVRRRRADAPMQRRNEEDEREMELATSVIGDDRDSVSSDGEGDAPSELKVTDETTASGVIPIKVDVPISGEETRFERIIVRSEDLFITAHYLKKPKTAAQSLLACLIPCN